MGNTSDYNSKYYKRHRKKLLNKKNSRYKNDDEYREACKRRAKLQASLKAVSTPEREYSVVHNGATEPAFFLPQMAKIINRNKMVLYGWKKDGILPTTKNVLSRERVLYSYSQVMAIKNIIGQVDNKDLDISYDELKVILSKVWDTTYSVDIVKEKIQEVILCRKPQVRKKQRTVRKGT